MGKLGLLGLYGLIVLLFCNLTVIKLLLQLADLIIKTVAVGYCRRNGRFLYIGIGVAEAVVFFLGDTVIGKLGDDFFLIFGSGQVAR